MQSLISKVPFYFLPRISSFLRIFERFRLNEWKSCFFFPGCFFFPASKIEWMNDMWTFPRKKKNTKKHTKYEKKKQPTFVKKKEDFIKILMNGRWTFPRKEKNTSCFFFGFRKKNTIFGFEWMNGQRTYPRKKKYGTFVEGLEGSKFWPNFWNIFDIFFIFGNCPNLKRLYLLI